MKKILSFFMIMFLLIFSVNAVDLIYNQDEVIQNFNHNQYNTKIEYVIAGADNSYNIGQQYGDLKIYLKDITNDVYFIYGNNVINSKLNITYVDIVDNETIATTQEVFLNETGDYYFKLDRTYNYDRTEILFNAEDNSDGYLYVVFAENEYVKDTETNIFTDLIVYIIELLVINVTIWKVGFYIGLGVLMIGSIVLLVLWAYRFYSWADSQDIFKKNKKNNLRK